MTGRDAGIAMRQREAAETPEARAARRASDWFVTYRRIWAAGERAGVESEPERNRFVCARLWPELDEGRSSGSCPARSRLAGSPGPIPRTPWSAGDSRR